MPLNIEDYALIGDLHTGALIGRNGSIDWLCLPRFDSASTFGALLGDKHHGRWLLAPADKTATSARTYRGNSLVLETIWETSEGTVEVLEYMALNNRRADVIRRIKCLRGSVKMRQDLRVRFDYARSLPWVQHHEEFGKFCLIATAGPDSVVYRGPDLKADGHSHIAEFMVHKGQTVDIELTWYPSHREAPAVIDHDDSLDRTLGWWENWTSACTVRGRYATIVQRSLVLLRALTHEDTGGIVAAATTSLPEQFGGSRNWDYRYVWLRDAALTLSVFIENGLTDEAERWRGWLLRAIAGDPKDIQIMYGLAGERILTEQELPQFPGFGGASPVRIGNGAFTQYQGDVLGELMVALDDARSAGVPETKFSWPLQRALLDGLMANHDRPDNGIWEIRGEQQYFTQSRVMAWAALDRGVRAVREFGLKGSADKWAATRDQIRDEIEAKGFDTERNTYVQYYGSSALDASLLQLPQVGYCAPDDPRMVGTVAAIENELITDGFVFRYRTESSVDGLPPGEYPFLACSFWLVEQYARSGRVSDGYELMDRLVALRNDVGMLSEEYDPKSAHQAGNTPQALSHLALIRAAIALANADPDSASAPTS